MSSWKVFAQIPCLIHLLSHCPEDNWAGKEAIQLHTGRSITPLAKIIIQLNIGYGIFWQCNIYTKWTQYALSNSSIISRIYFCRKQQQQHLDPWQNFSNIIFNFIQVGVWHWGPNRRKKYRLFLCIQMLVTFEVFGINIFSPTLISL